MKKSYLIVTILLLALGAACFICFDAIQIKLLADPTADALLRGFLSRIGLCPLFIFLLIISGGKRLIEFRKEFPRMLLWSLPCFMVALVNFPYSGVVSKAITFHGSNWMWLYILYVISIALLEEFVFRGVLYLTVKDMFRNKRHAPLLTVVVCAAAFSLIHLTNLIYGADIGLTLLQCLYAFLIGAMLTVTVMKTKNIWICILIHALFDFGGLLTANKVGIASGDPWDLLFWILTITSGVLCAGHIIYSLIRLEKDYVSGSTF